MALERSLEYDDKYYDGKKLWIYKHHHIPVTTQYALVLQISVTRDPK